MEYVMVPVVARWPRNRSENGGDEFPGKVNVDSRATLILSFPDKGISIKRFCDKCKRRILNQQGGLFLFNAFSKGGKNRACFIFYEPYSSFTSGLPNVSAKEKVVLDKIGNFGQIQNGLITLQWGNSRLTGDRKYWEI